MSNYFTFIFSLFLLSFPLTGNTAEIKALDSLLLEADTYFQYDRFEPATEIYENLYQEGYYQEEMLYRLAFMQEQAGNFPASIFYLRKVQWEIGGKNLEEKIQQLMLNASKERLSAGEGWSDYRLFVQHYYTEISLGLGICLSLTLLFLFIPRNWTLRFAIFFACLGLIFGGVLLEHSWAHNSKAVISTSSRYYESPSFAAKHYALPIGPGATVKIMEVQDIWARVKMAQFEAWVPLFAIRQI
ncbi:MAG: hypothetical protein AAFR87_25110 [Bacteroidota bacterium]